MPIMSAVEAAFCRSAPWQMAARRVVPWATQDVSLAGDVLEIGGGGGAMAERLVHANSSIRLTTTDFDPAMVALATGRLSQFPDAAARQADATQLPFDDSSFDTVVSFLMLHHVIEWQAAIAEVARVLRPGGCFVGYDLTATRFASLLHVIDRSPHELIDHGALEPVLESVGLEPGVRYSFGKHLLRFSVRKPN